MPLMLFSAPLKSRFKHDEGPDIGAAWSLHSEHAERHIHGVCQKAGRYERRILLLLFEGTHCRAEGKFEKKAVNRHDSTADPTNGMRAQAGAGSRL